MTFSVTHKYMLFYTLNIFVWNMNLLIYLEATKIFCNRKLVYRVLLYAVEVINKKEISLEHSFAALGRFWIVLGKKHL